MKPTHFRGHLLEMKGVVLERQHRHLEAFGEREIVRGISILDLAGHTPGHIGVRIADAGQSLLMVSDMLFPVIHPADAYYARLGDAPAEALIGLLRFIARAPVVVFNAPFNRGSLERAFTQQLGEAPELAWIDLMVMLPTLYPERIGGQARMDAWLGSFGIDRYDSRDALLESLIVAQLHQVALAATRHFNLPTPRDLLDTESSRRWLRGG